MEAQHNQEFNNSLKQLGDLYEEGKDCLNNISVSWLEREHQDRLFEILRKNRDISAVTLKENAQLKESNRVLLEALETIHDEFDEISIMKCWAIICKAIKEAKGGE